MKLPLPPELPTVKAHEETEAAGTLSFRFLPLCTRMQLTLEAPRGGRERRGTIREAAHLGWGRGASGYRCPTNLLKKDCCYLFYSMTPSLK